MEHHVPAPGIAPGRLRITAGTFRGVRLMLDATRIKVRGKRPTRLPAPFDGVVVTFPKGPGAFLRTGNVEVNGRMFQLAPPISTGLFILALVPVGLLAIGFGLLGGLAGGLLMGANMAILQSGSSKTVKTLALTGIALAALGAAAVGIFLSVAAATQ